MIVQPIPSAQDWTIEAKFALEGAYFGRARAGFILAAAGATPNLLDWGISVDNTPPQPQGLQWTWPGNFSAGIAGGNAFGGNCLYMRVQHIQATGHYRYFASTDGITWIRFADFADPITVTRIGIFVNEHDNLGLSKCRCEWFRRTA